MPLAGIAPARVDSTMTDADRRDVHSTPDCDDFLTLALNIRSCGTGARTSKELGLWVRRRSVAAPSRGSLIALRRQRAAFADTATSPPSPISASKRGVGSGLTLVGIPASSSVSSTGRCREPLTVRSASPRSFWRCRAAPNHGQSVPAYLPKEGALSTFNRLCVLQRSARRCRTLRKFAVGDSARRAIAPSPVVRLRYPRLRQDKGLICPRRRAARPRGRAS